MQSAESVQSFDQLVTASPKAFVYYWAEWCAPCKLVSPKIAAYATEYPEITFITVDIVEKRAIMDKMKIKCLPTFHVFRNGALALEIMGLNYAELEQRVTELATS